MKRLSLLLVGVVLFLAACDNCQAPQDGEKQETATVQEHKHKCCKELTEEQKAFIADWEDFENQTEERKNELLEKAKSSFEERKSKIESLSEELQEAFKEELSVISEKLSDWGALAIAEKKDLMDQAMKITAKKGCSGDKKCCKSKGEGKCQGKEHKH